MLDNNLSPRLAAAMDVLVEQDRHVVKHLADLFDSRSVPDVEWMAELARDGGWVVISGDMRIQRNKHEREAWRRSHLTGFFLAPGWSKLPNLEKAARLLLWWPRIVEQARLVHGGAAFEVPINSGGGRFRQL